MGGSAQIKHLAKEGNSTGKFSAGGGRRERGKKLDSFMFSIGNICVILSPMLDQLMKALMDLFDSLSKQLLSYERAKQELQSIFQAYEIEIDSLTVLPQIEQESQVLREIGTKLPS